jgi:UPF0716 protein FxsA
MFGRLLLAALILALADAFVLLIVAGQIGALLTIGLVVLTALVGSLLVRSEGRATLQRLQRRLQNFEAPTDELLDGVLIILGGGFLITPGLLTDLTGFLFVIPFTRAPLRVALKRWVITPSVRKKLQNGSLNIQVGGTLGNARSNTGFGGEGRTRETTTDDSYYDLDNDMYDVEDEKSP